MNTGKRTCHTCDGTGEFYGPENPDGPPKVCPNCDGYGSYESKRGENRKVHPRTLQQCYVLKDVLMLRAFKKRYIPGLFGWPFFQRLERLVLGVTSQHGYTLGEFARKGWIVLSNRGVSHNLRVWELTAKGEEFLHETRRWALPDWRWLEVQEDSIDPKAMLWLIELDRHQRQGWESDNGWITPDGEFVPCGFGQHLSSIDNWRDTNDLPRMDHHEAGVWAETKGWMKILKWQNHAKHRIYCIKMTPKQRAAYAIWASFFANRPETLTSSLPSWEVFIEPRNE